MDIKLKYSKFIPFPGFYACTIFNCIFRHPRYKNKALPKSTYNHELIHVYQQLDFVNGNEKLYILGGVIFYILYFIEWLIKLIISAFTFGKVKAYRSISFEQEAYNNTKEKNYSQTRRKFAWIKYIFKLVK